MWKDEFPVDIGDRVYRLSPQAVMEEFEEAALVLRLTDRHLFELNQTACRVLEFTDGARNVSQVADALAQTSQIPQPKAFADTWTFYEQMSTQGVVEMVDPNSDSQEKLGEAGVSAKPARYARNPDVVLREEDADGGLLFNPDTRQVKVLNTPGLFIWKQCDGTHDLDEIAKAVQRSFDLDAPPVEQIVQDVREFVDGMVASGFIGTMESHQVGSQS